MEARPSPPVPPIDAWDDHELREQLCLALREVGTSNRMLPDGTGALAAIARVKELHAAVDRRSLDVSSRLSRLSGETRWDLEALLRDTLAYPEAVPYLASTPDPTCGQCGTAIPRTALIALCRECVRTGLESVASGRTENHLDTCTMCGRDEKGLLVYAYATDWRNYCTPCLRDAETRYGVSST